MVSPHPRSRWRVPLRLAVIAVVVVGLVYALRGLQLDELGDALADAKWWPIAIAAVINFGLLGCKALAWHVMLAPEHVVPIRRLVRYTITAFAASVIVPARGGEVLRLVALRRFDGVPLTQSAAVALAEKLIDVLAMLLIMAPIPWLLPGLPPSVSWWIGGLSAGALIALVILVIAVGRVRPTGWFGRIVTGMRVLRRPSRFSGTVALLVVLWLLDIVMVQLTLYAVGIDLPWAGAALVLFTSNIAIALPSTPGQVGAFELGAVAGLTVLHVARAPAMAFAVLYHALQIVPLLAVGLILDGKLLFRGWPDEAASTGSTDDPRSSPDR